MQKRRFPHGEQHLSHFVATNACMNAIMYPHHQMHKLMLSLARPYALVYARTLTSPYNFHMCMLRSV